MADLSYIQDEIYRLSASGGGEILLPPGEHLIERGFKLKSNIKIRGFGRGATVLKPADPHDFDEPFFSVDEGDHPATTNIEISDLSIDGEFDEDRQAYPERLVRDFKSLDQLGAKHWRMGVYLTNEFAGTPFENVRIRNLNIRRCANGMHILSTDGVLVENCHFHRNGCVIQHHHNLYFRRCANIIVRNTELSSSPHGVGLNLGNGCRSFLMENSFIHDNGFRGVRFDGLEALSEDIALVNCIITGNCRNYPGEPSLRLHTIKNFRIEGNVFADNNTERDIQVRLSRRGRIIGNRFIGRAPDTAVVERCRGVVDKGNLFAPDTQALLSAEAAPISVVEPQDAA